MNCIQRSVVLTEGVWIDAPVLGLGHSNGEQRPLNLAQARDAFERELVRETLRVHGHRIAPAARQLGVSRVTLYRIVTRLKLSEREPEPTAGAAGVTHLSSDRIEP
jgi:DNA-binding NtrC family response regulator